MPLRPCSSRVRVCLGSVLALLASPLIAAPTSYEWKNVVIKGGGFVSGLVYHPAERDVFYARTDVGGVFRWQASSRSWLPLTDHLGKDESQLTGVISLALDPNDPRRVYLACGQYLPWWAQQGAILASTDRGATWSRSNLPLKLGGNSDGRSAGERLQVDPNLGSLLLLGSSQDGLWRSTDYAQTWTRIDSFTPTATTLVVFDPRSGSAGTATQTIYVGVASTTAPSLFRSTDGGATWAAVPGAPTGLMPHHAKFAADGTLYLTLANGLGPNGVTSGAVWKLNSSTGAWTNITPPTGQGGFAGLALDAQHAQTLVVTTLDRWSPRDEIYRSTDGGATWKALNALSQYDGSSAPYSTTSTPHWLGDIEIDPFDSARAFYVTGYGVFGTETLTQADVNGQLTWIFRNDGLEETVPLGLVSPPDGAPLVSVIGDIDGFRHDDLTVSPARGRHTPRVGTNNSIDFAELAPQLMVRTHSGGTIRGSRSTNGGESWSYFASAPAAATQENEGSIAISADGTRIVWAPERAGLYLSVNDGSTWTASIGGPPASTSTNHVPVADRANGSKFYVYNASAGRVYASTDGGVTFAQTSASLPTGGEPLRAAPGKEGHLWFTGWSSGLYRSTDSGATFAKLGTVQEANRLGFGRAAPGATYPALYLWGKIAGVTGFHRSVDEGATWVRINDDAHQFGWINAIIGDPRTYGRVYLATGGRGIIYGDISASAPSLTWLTPRTPLANAGASVSLSTTLGVIPAPVFEWRLNGSMVTGATQPTLTLTDLQPAAAGLYAPSATSDSVAFVAEPAIVGVTTTSKVIGAGEVVGSDITHPNGHVFDQVLVTGAAEAITADHAQDQMTRTSFVDLDGDIVQVEFSGPGTLALVLASATPAAPPANYHQPAVAYVTGHAGIVITGANERTNISVFTVGRATAFDPTGNYNFLQSPSATNVPAHNGSPLFAGHAETPYDGIADLAYIAISTTNGRFGGVRASNANFFASQGYTGIYAPDVAFSGPLFVGDITAFDAAQPVLVVGSVSDARITGGDLLQANGVPVQVGGIAQLHFWAGSDSHGRSLPAQHNQAVLLENAHNVTAQIVVNP